MRTDVEAREDVPSNAFSRYEDLDVAPSAVYRSKAAHRRAVLRLAADVTSAIETDPVPATDGTADSGPVGDVERRR